MTHETIPEFVVKNNLIYILCKKNLNGNSELTFGERRYEIINFSLFTLIYAIRNIRISLSFLDSSRPQFFQLVNMYRADVSNAFDEFLMCQLSLDVI